MRQICDVRWDTELSTMLGLARGAAGNWRQGIALPSLRSCLILVARFGVSLDWLIFGTGPRYVAERLNDTQRGDAALPLSTDAQHMMRFVAHWNATELKSNLVYGP